MDVSSKIRLKLKTENYSLKIITWGTGIEISKLEPDSRTPFSASELLTLCSFMNWDPRDFWK